VPRRALRLLQRSSLPGASSARSLRHRTAARYSTAWTLLAVTWRSWFVNRTGVRSGSRIAYPCAPRVICWVGFQEQQTDGGCVFAAGASKTLAAMPARTLRALVNGCSSAAICAAPVPRLGAVPRRACGISRLYHKSARGTLSDSWPPSPPPHSLAWEAWVPGVRKKRRRAAGRGMRGAPARGFRSPSPLRKACAALRLRYAELMVRAAI